MSERTVYKTAFLQHVNHDYALSAPTLMLDPGDIRYTERMI